MFLLKIFLILKSLLLTPLVFSNENKNELEVEFRKLSSELRCMVCQNQSLLDSDSELAKDLKMLIYEKLKNGESKEEIKKFLVDRYGEFILFKPLLNQTNFLLWIAPILSFLIIALIGFKKTRINNRK